MTPLFIHYPKCSTCIRARKWLEANGIDFETRDIVTECPSIEELNGWLPQSGLALRKFFNTSGVRYQELHLKERINREAEPTLLSLLASDGKLIKRPLLILSDRVLVGFNERQWAERLL